MLKWSLKLKMAFLAALINPNGTCLVCNLHECCWVREKQFPSNSCFSGIEERRKTFLAGLASRLAHPPGACPLAPGVNLGSVDGGREGEVGLGQLKLVWGQSLWYRRGLMLLCKDWQKNESGQKGVTEQLCERVNRKRTLLELTDTRQSFLMCTAVACHRCCYLVVPRCASVSDSVFL